jgi:glutamate mutase epsilon subunit
MAQLVEPFLKVNLPVIYPLLALGQGIVAVGIPFGVHGKELRA